MMNIKTSLITLSQLLAVAVAQAAVLAPYTNDFSGTGQNVAFPNENTNVQWNISGGQYVNSYSAGSGTPSSASIDITNLDNVPFTITTQFTMTAATAPNSNNASQLGFGVFSSASNFSSAGLDAYYLADFSYSANNLLSGNPMGTLRITRLQAGTLTGFSFTNGLAIAPGSGTNFALAIGTTYTLQLTGSYVGSTLNMTLSLWNADGTIQIGTTASASDTNPLTGDYFGYRDRLGAGGSMTLAYDNFSVVPEPGVSSLALVAGLSFLGASRRRRK